MIKSNLNYTSIKNIQTKKTNPFIRSGNANETHVALTTISILAFEVSMSFEYLFQYFVVYHNYFRHNDNGDG